MSVLSPISSKTPRMLNGVLRSAYSTLPTASAGLPEPATFDASARETKIASGTNVRRHTPFVPKGACHRNNIPIPPSPSVSWRLPPLRENSRAQPQRKGRTCRERLSPHSSLQIRSGTPHKARRGGAGNCNSSVRTPRGQTAGYRQKAPA